MAETLVNIEAEQALIGAALINNDAFHAVSGIVEASQFSEPVHRVIWGAIGDLCEAGKVATPATVKAFLPNQKIGEMTVMQYVIRMAAEAVTIVNAPDYAAAIADCAVRRDVIRAAHEMIAMATSADPGMSGVVIKDKAEAILSGNAAARAVMGAATFGSYAAQSVESAAAAYQRDGGLSGLATGLVALDQMLGGMSATDLMILAGRPAMGKTSLATNIAFNVAHAGTPVLFFSLEMSGEQLAGRVLAEQSALPLSAIRRGSVRADQLETYIKCATAYERLPLIIDQAGSLTISAMQSRARRAKRRHGIGLVIIDYLQLMQGSGRQGASRVNEITEITVGLKAMAKELGVPVLALSQLSRQVETRDDKRPMLSDLRESGSIEQDADIVMFVYRDEYYLKAKEPKFGTEAHLNWQDAMASARGKAEVIIGKQRHGPTGAVYLGFQAEFTRFHDLPQSEIPERFEA